MTYFVTQDAGVAHQLVKVARERFYMLTGVEHKIGAAYVNNRPALTKHHNGRAVVCG